MRGMIGEIIESTGSVTSAFLFHVYDQSLWPVARTSSSAGASINHSTCSGPRGRDLSRAEICKLCQTEELAMVSATSRFVRRGSTERFRWKTLPRAFHSFARNSFRRNDSRESSSSHPFVSGFFSALTNVNL